MIVVCAWCARQDRPSFLKETAPFRDTQVSHSICPRHHAALRAQLRAQAGGRRASEEEPA